MKTLTEFISEHVQNDEQNSQELEQNVQESESDGEVWVIKDKDLDGAIFDVCDTEDDANRLLDRKKKENPDVHMEIVKGKRSEYVKEDQ